MPIREVVYAKNVLNGTAGILQVPQHDAHPSAHCTFAFIVWRVYDLRIVGRLVRERKFKIRVLQLCLGFAVIDRDIIGQPRPVMRFLQHRSG